MVFFYYLGESLENNTFDRFIKIEGAQEIFNILRTGWLNESASQTVSFDQAIVESIEKIETFEVEINESNRTAPSPEEAAQLAENIKLLLRIISSKLPLNIIILPAKIKLGWGGSARENVQVALQQSVWDWISIYLYAMHESEHYFHNIFAWDRIKHLIKQSGIRNQLINHINAATLILENIIQADADPSENEITDLLSTLSYYPLRAFTESLDFYIRFGNFRTISKVLDYLEKLFELNEQHDAIQKYIDTSVENIYQQYNLRLIRVLRKAHTLYKSESLNSEQKEAYEVMIGGCFQLIWHYLVEPVATYQPQTRALRAVVGKEPEEAQHSQLYSQRIKHILALAKFKLLAYNPHNLQPSTMEDLAKFYNLSIEDYNQDDTPQREV